MTAPMLRAPVDELAARLHDQARSPRLGGLWVHTLRGSVRARVRTNTSSLQDTYRERSTPNDHEVMTHGNGIT
eukprot:4735598-Pleurochrysis_carterae.AAC.1